MQGIDATDPAAILESLSGAGGFPPVSTGILQAIAADRGADVATATASVLTTNSSNATVRTLPRLLLTSGSSLFCSMLGFPSMQSCCCVRVAG